MIQGTMDSAAWMTTKGPMRLLVLVVLCCSMGHPARAQRVSQMTGNTLLEACESKTDFQQAMCFGYITGVTDLDGLDGATFPERKRICMDTNVTNGQVIDVVVKHLKEHPEERHLSAAALVIKAVVKAFPCKLH